LRLGKWEERAGRNGREGEEVIASRRYYEHIAASRDTEQLATKRHTQGM